MQSIHAKNKSRNELLVTLKGLKYGAFAGLIATLLISLAVAIAEIASGLRMGTFYSIIGITLGLNNVVNAGYLGFGLHLVIGTLIGTVPGGIGIRWRKIRLLIPVKSSLLGIGSRHYCMVNIISPNNIPFNTAFHSAHSCNFSNCMAKDRIG